MRFDELEEMHFGQIKMQGERLTDFEVDLGIHHGEKTDFATLHQEESFRPKGLDHLYTTLDQGKISLAFSHFGSGYVIGTYPKDDLLPHIGLIG